MKDNNNNQSGFTILEVAVASVISMVGLVFLASLFTLAMSQNRLVKQFTSTAALAQEKVEELNAIEITDLRMAIGGDLNAETTVGGVNYFDTIFIDDDGQVLLNDDIPEGRTGQYRRFWRLEADADLVNTTIITVRVAATQPGHNQGRTEETILVTVRSN